MVLCIEPHLTGSRLCLPRLRSQPLRIAVVGILCAVCVRTVAELNAYQKRAFACAGLTVGRARRNVIASGLRILRLSGRTRLCDGSLPLMCAGGGRRYGRGSRCGR